MSGLKSTILATFSIVAVQPLQAQVPAPEEVVGWPPCADYQLADDVQLMEYFRLLAAATDRVQLVEIGRSAMGRPMPLLFISSEENMRHLDRGDAARTLLPQSNRPAVRDIAQHTHTAHLRPGGLPGGHHGATRTAREN